MFADTTIIRLRALRLLGFAVLTLSLTACNILSSVEKLDPEAAPNAPEKFSFDAFRAQDPQSSLGAAEHPKILASHGGSYSDPKLESMLALVTGRLVDQSGTSDRAFDITILDSPKVNAFALPGGYLYVTRGLLALSNDTAEVAAVLAHEMAHVSSNHGVERSQQAKAVDIADRVVNDVVTNTVAGKVAKASTVRRLAVFSQKQELQADAVGIKVLAKAGFDAFAAARFLKSMDRYQAWRSSLNARTEDMSSTHPSTPRRVELARRHARATGPEGSGERDHERLLTAVDGMLFGDKAKEGYIRGNRFSHTKLGVTFSAPENFELTNRADAVLASGPGEMALRFDAVPQTVSGNVEDYIRSGWVNGLQEQTVRQTEINGQPAATARAEAGDWQFAITVVELDDRFYRFILAAPRNARDTVETSDTIAGTFRKMTLSERKAIKPLRIRVVKAVSGDSVASMAARMTGVAKKENLFLALNGLDVGAALQPGDTVKIVTE